MNLSKFPKRFILLTVVLSGLLFYSCGESTEKDNSTNLTEDNSGNLTNVKDNIMAFLLSPGNGSRPVYGDSLFFRSSLSDSTKKIDEASYYVDGSKIGSSSNPSEPFAYSTKGLRVGKHTIRVSIRAGDKDYSANSSIYLYSDLEPKEIQYKIIKKYKHDNQAYTQGLIYEDGIMYEGTGTNGGSSLRKVDFKTGNLLQSYSLPSNIFGEGIVVKGSKIYQLTYRAKLVYVYDKNSFELLNTMTFEPEEGWGITNLGDNLAMTDGVSNYLYVLDPQLFTEIDRIPVYDNKGPLNSLNELENINGKIFSNIYQTSNIVVIDPATGRIEYVMYMQDLIPEEYIGDTDNVFNGIAWDPKTKHLFVTGKRWPVLYEIELINYPF